MSAATKIATDDQAAVVLVRDKWLWFLALGVTLIAGGLFAVALPTITSMAASLVLGVTLVVVGLVKIIESFKVKEWTGFVWQLMLGVVEVVGGVLIYVSPLKRAIAITLLIAIVFVVQGVTQIVLALKVKPQPGWRWLLIAGVAALCASVALAMKFPFTRYYTPATIGGVSLLLAGCAYVVIAFAIRKIRLA
jgi:uncharacterized membrane protein HdeD (DUF308 family)